MATSADRATSLSRVLLALLAHEAPLEDFEDERRAAGDPAAVDLVDAALRVRRMLADLRRREQELTALNETAQDLAGLRDVELVLRAIVRRARELLGSELAYITLIDAATSTTYMRTVEGNISEGFAHLRLPLGSGLGGVVAERGTPVATADFQSDERIRHPRLLASAVREEGIVAVVGVPLRRGDRVIGVLYAADRYERSFPSHDVALLSSLATHAAIAIDNARMDEEAETALGALARAGAAARERGEALERAAAARERLLRAVLDGGTLDDLAVLVAELIGAGVVVVDPAGRVLAGAAGPGAPSPQAWAEQAAAGPRGAALRDALATAIRSGRSQRVHPDHPAAQWIAPVAAGPDASGAIIAARDEPLNDGERSILENAALVVGVHLASERAVVAAEERVRAELLTDVLLAPDRHPDHLRRRARLLGVDLDAPHAVAVVCGDGGALRRALHDLTLRSGGLAGEHLGSVVALIAARTLDEAAAALRPVLQRAAGGATAGVAGPCEGARELAAGFEEAERVRRGAQALGRSGVVTSDALGAFGLLLAPHARGDVDRFVEARLGPVVRWDAERGSELVGTLATYFEHGGNVTRAAADLHVHVNTLYQRLERIRALLGQDPQDPAAALELHLALRLRALRADG